MPGGKLKKRIKYKPIIIAAIILCVTGYLIFTGIRDTMTYYLTVSEVLAKQPGQLTETQKVDGVITPGSVQWDPKTLILSFKLADKAVSTSLTVHYKGVIPDSFKPGEELIVEGVYQWNGVFFATTLMPKCASKYE